MTAPREEEPRKPEDLKPVNPRKIAHWRYEQITDLLDDTLTRRERRVLLGRITRAPVRWPSGREEEISETTLYRWIRAWKARGIEGLMPRRPKGRKPRRPLKRGLVERAIALLREEPRRSLTMIQALLKCEKRGKVTRSTLHRRLQAHRAYPSLRRMARGNGDRRLRRRFEASRPHQIWQSDSKGPFTVRFVKDHRKVSVHVMTVLDDFSRGVLAVRIVLAPDLRAAVLVFRSAAGRWGLPGKFYADRASIFDSYAFRGGLAELGVHRIKTRVRNASARGKIEAYHRIIESWFIRELRHQRVHDLEHLNRLITGLLESLYMEHRHRSLKKTPREALAGCLSERQVSLDRLTDAFLLRTEKKTHPKTGEVELGGTLFKVPAGLAGRKLPFAFDPVETDVAFVEKPGGSRERLRLAVERVSDEPHGEPRGSGRLQALYDHWQGRKLPQAQAGFGLPEIFALFSKHLQRNVPHDEAEARLIQDFYHKRGPLERAATEAAFEKIFRKLGSKRPLAAYLDLLSSRIVPPTEER
jgi:transposase InsO family protein